MPYRNATRSRMKPANALLSLLLLCLPACSQEVRPENLDVETYRYEQAVASEPPAMVRGSPIYSKLLRIPAGSAYITHIDGRIVPEIDDGGFQWMLAGSQMKGIAYPLTPGAHVLTGAVKSGGTAPFELIFNAKSGERYTIMAMNESNGGPALIRLWLEDSAHQPVVPDQLMGSSPKQ